MRRIGVAISAAATVAVVTVAGFAPTAAWASDVGLEVVNVNGRQVQLVMTLAPSIDVSPNASVVGTIDVAGNSLPALTRVEVNQDSRPTTAILVLDASGSMKGAGIQTARAAATTFVSALPADVKVGVIAFNDQSRVLARPTTVRSNVLTQIANVQAAGGTALFDAVRMGLAMVPDGERARLVVLSDGKDTVSSTTLKEVTTSSSSGDVPIDVVALQSSTDELRVLRDIATGSHGTLLAANTVGELPEAFTSAATSFGARVYLTSTIPESIGASGQSVTAKVALDGANLQQTTTLPIAASLAAGGQGGAAPVSAPPAAAILTSPPPTTEDWAVPILLGVAVAASLLLIVAMISRAARMRSASERVDQVLTYQAGAAQVASVSDSGESRSAFARVDEYLSSRSTYRPTQIALAAAEVHMTPAEWLATRLGVMLALSLGFWVLLRSPWLGLFSGLLLGWLITAAWLRSRVEARREAFAEQLPDYMMLLSSSLRAGMSFTHALETTSAEGHGEVGRQMQRALREVQIGSATEVALMECADRMDNDDLRWTVTALSIQREVGGSLSAILDTAVNTIKARYELRREVRTLSAEGRLSGYILLGLPLGVAAFLFVFRREYVSLLWTTTLGIEMLILIGVFMVLGWIWMRSVVRIKV